MYTLYCNTEKYADKLPHAIELDIVLIQKAQKCYKNQCNIKTRELMCNVGN